MILIIDNFDSFTFNLARYFCEIGSKVKVFRNNALTIRAIEIMNPSHIVISPGPCTPFEAGISLDIIKHFCTTIPILGVCLGHQAIGVTFGAKLIRASRLMHGKTSLIFHNGKYIFRGLPSPFTAARYHSLILERESIPSCLIITAETKSGEVMGLRHRTYPVEGVQFHPESILSENGHQMLKNFLTEGRISHCYP